MTALYVIAFAIYGALISRLHGSDWPVPRWVRNVLWALPFGLVGLTVSLPITLLATCLCLAGKALGHGRGISLTLPLKGEPERIEYITLWAVPYLTTYQYKLLILAVSGVLAVSGGALISPYILLGGLLKPAAYTLGWSAYPKQATIIGELLTGFFAYAFLGYAHAT